MECDFCLDGPATHMVMQFASCGYCFAETDEGRDRLESILERKRERIANCSTDVCTTANTGTRLQRLTNALRGVKRALVGERLRG